MADIMVEDEEQLQQGIGKGDQSESQRAQLDSALEALRQSEETIRALLNAATETAVLVDPQGTILALNRVAAQRVGKSVDELLGVCVYDLLPPELAESRRAMVDEVARSGLPVRFEDERAGILFDNHLYPVFDAQGEVIRLVIFSRDMTKRKQAEIQSVRYRSERDSALEAWQASEINFRALAEAMPTAIAVVQNDRIRYANSATGVLTGYAQAELQTMDFWDFVHPEFRALTREQELARERGEEAAARFEIKVVTKEGQERWVDVSVGAIQFEGKPAGLAVALDITQRKEMELTLRASEAQNRALLDAIPDMFFRLSRDGTYLDFMPAQGMQPYRPPSEFLGKTVLEILPAEMARAVMHHVQQTLATGQTQIFEYSLEVGDQLHHYEARLVPSGLQADQVLAIVRDITQRREREAIVEEERERIARDLYDGLAHTLYLLGLRLDYSRRHSRRDSWGASGEPHPSIEMEGTDPPGQGSPAQAPHTRAPLSALELTILRLVAQGLSNSDIGAELGMAEKTIGNRLTGIFNKLGVSNRVQAALYALRQGLASLDEGNE
ncbi:MAG: PAS domain S-box protein [Anaerolineales bacterium]|nr:MAG: PAS domain S-box protein [Anaerolineales bacterium]